MTAAAWVSLVGVLVVLGVWTACMVLAFGRAYRHLGEREAGLDRREKALSEWSAELRRQSNGRGPRA